MRSKLLIRGPAPLLGSRSTYFVPDGGCLRVFVFLAAVLAAGAATAADIKVMISAGFFNLCTELGPAFEKSSGQAHHYARTLSWSASSRSRADPCARRRFRRHGAARHSTPDIFRRCAAKDLAATRSRSRTAAFPLHRRGGKHYHEGRAKAFSGTQKWQRKLASYTAQFRVEDAAIDTDVSIP